MSSLSYAVRTCHGLPLPVDLCLDTSACDKDTQMEFQCLRHRRSCIASIVLLCWMLASGLSTAFKLAPRSTSKVFPHHPDSQSGSAFDASLVSPATTNYSHVRPTTKYGSDLASTRPSLHRRPLACTIRYIERLPPRWKRHNPPHSQSSTPLALPSPPPHRFPQLLRRRNSPSRRAR